jgi:hypothetical protein
MRKTRTEIKAESLATYEAMLDEVLCQGATTDGQTLTDIEEAALRVRAEGEASHGGTVGGQERAKLPWPPCPSCGQEMRYKGAETSLRADAQGRGRGRTPVISLRTVPSGAFSPG